MNKLLKVILGVPKATVCFVLECAVIPVGIVAGATGAIKIEEKLRKVTFYLDKEAGKAVGKVASVIALVGSLTSCDILEGMRQSDPSYVPRSERREIKKALKDWKIGRAQWNKDHAKEIKEAPELLDLP